ncbi:MAG: hypothetical protein EPN47_14985 [Acidobacteria bacterium]|nr:MAG: hypothetical protein EPN47_14985 [Acidobacteriota bacterium]
MCGTENAFFKKRTEEVVENKGSQLKNEPERIGKRSGEVVENTFQLEKRTGNEPADLAENEEPRNSEPERILTAFRTLSCRL